MHQQIRQDLVLDVSGFSPRQRMYLFRLQQSILDARYREAEADAQAAESRAEAEAEWARRAALAREEKERNLVAQTQQVEDEKKYRDLVEHRERQWQRPSHMHHVEVAFDPERHQFRAAYFGVVAWGNTPEIACDNFDHLWLFGELA
jgi:hypothetical protein